MVRIHLPPAKSRANSGTGVSRDERMVLIPPPRRAGEVEEHREITWIVEANPPLKTAPRRHWNPDRMVTQSLTTGDFAKHLWDEKIRPTKKSDKSRTLPGSFRA